MRTININLDELATKSLDIGYAGESHHVTVVIHCASFFKSYPNAVASMIAGSSDGALYPIVLTRQNSTLVWEVSDSDVAHAGGGRYQITFTQDNEIIKTEYGSYSVSPSMVVSGDPPEPMENWMQEAQDVLNDLLSYDDISASATMLPSGSTATAEITTVEGHKNIALGIPKGDKGNTGATGATGATPNISIGDVETLQPDQEAYVELDESSTAEAPVINFGLPKGETGAIENVYGSTIDMTSQDSTKLSTAINAKLNANQGSANAGKFMRVGSAGAVSYDNPVERYASVSNFPATGDAGKVYVAEDTAKIYVWDSTNTDYVMLCEAKSNTFFGTSSTGSSTGEKAVTVSSGFYALSDIPEGTILFVKFTNQNTATYNVSLNVNNGGSKSVHTMTNASNSNMFRWNTGEWVCFVYLGSYWRAIHYSGIRGATSIASGETGLVPAPPAGSHLKFLRGDGTWSYPANMVGATSSSAGSAGAVPAPSAGDQDKVLKGNGTWGNSGLLMVNEAFSIPSSGDSVTYTMSGMSASYQLVRWNFSASAENNPPVDLEWTTGDGVFTITTVAGDSDETIQPVFADTVSVAIEEYIEE